MAYKDLQYWPLDESKKPIFEDVGGSIGTVPIGVLKPNGEPAHLQYNPVGWKESLVKYGRSVKHLGRTVDFTVPLKFVRDGAKIIKNTLWRKGWDAVLFLAIWKLNKTAFPDKYDLWYTAELDLSTVEQSDGAITVQATEGGLDKLFKANENTIYDLDIHNDPQKKTLYIDGVPLQFSASWQMNDSGFASSLTQPALTIASSEGSTQGVIIQDTEVKVGFSVADTRENWLLKSIDKNISAVLTGKIIIPSKQNDVQIDYIRFTKRNINDINTPTFYTLVSSTNPTPFPYTVNINLTVPMAPGDLLFFEGKATFDAGGTDSIDISKDGFINLKYDVVFNPTYHEGLSPKRVCQLLVDKFAPGYTVSSTFLDSLEDEIFLTSGQALRKFNVPAVFSTSIAKFYKSFQRWGIGLNIEGNQLVIEQHPYYFRTNKTVNIGEVSDCKVTIAKDLAANTFVFGYPDVEIDKVNGRDEFNVTTRYSGPGKRIIKELDLVGEYHAGMYEIEKARVDYYGKDTTDSSVDNTCYMINVSKGYSYPYYTGEMFLPFQNEIQIAGVKNQLAPGDLFTISGAASNNGSFTVVNFLYATGTTDIIFPNASFTGTPTTINGSVVITSTTNYKLNRPTFSSVTGLVFPNKAYNILLRPALSLINNGPYIRSICDFNDFNSIEFTHGDRNSSLVTVQGGITVKEDFNFPIGGLGAQLFKPYYAKFKGKATSAQWEIIRANPYSMIEFIWKGLTISAYIWDGGINPSTKMSEPFTVLLGPDTDMSKLIDIS